MPAVEALSTRLGLPVAKARALHGGDLSEVIAVTLNDGERLVAKLSPLSLEEARMLRALEGAGAPVPQVLRAEPGLLLLEYLPETAPTPRAWTQLGARLRRLHQAMPESATGYGWPRPYAFADHPIPMGDPQQEWPEFWARARLLAEPDALPVDLRRRLELLCDRLPDLLPASPHPALLHGDLWSGNLLFGPDDKVHLIDPACSRGDCEVDLAMLHLFGQPGGGFAESYGPLPAGWAERRALYQLWPALMHLRLFGAGYRGLVERLLSRVE